MHFTIGSKATSRPKLSDDAWRSYLGLLSQVRAVQDLSSKLGALARAAANAYHRALSTGTHADWVALAGAADEVSAYGKELASLAHLSQRELEAIAFFDAIARENADLLATRHIAA